MRKDYWRLSCELIAYVTTSRGGMTNEVFLASPERISYSAEVKKNLTTTIYNEFNLSSNSFKLKINEYLEVFVKSDELPMKDKYYKVGNFCELKGIGSIITQVNSNKADFEDIEFEAVFSDSYPGEVFFLSQDMVEYKPAFKEMSRRLNVSMNKKVRKWTVGHRYDTEDKTYYYLGEFVSRKSEDVSGYLSDLDMVPVYLVTSDVDSETNISEILKTRKMGNGVDEKDIQILYHLPSAVDSGKVLNNDITSINDYHHDIINNTINKNKTVTKYGNLKYASPEYIFNILSIQSISKYTYDSSVVNPILKVIEDLITNIIISSWDLSIYYGTSCITINDTTNKDDASNAIISTFINSIGWHPLTYYVDLFKALGLDLKEITNRLLLNCNPKNLMSDNLRDYIKYSEIFYTTRESNDSVIKNSTQRVDSTNYPLNVVTIEELFPNESNLVGALKNIINTARENIGLGVEVYYETNVGSKKKPKIYTTILVGLLDVVNYFGGIDKIPQEVADDMISSKFWKLRLNIDKDGELK